MERVMVTYKVKPDRVAENEEFVKAVYEELHQINDPDIHYATFRLDDGQTFVHIASFASAEKTACADRDKGIQGISGKSG